MTTRPRGEDRQGWQGRIDGPGELLSVWVCWTRLKGTVLHRPPQHARLVHDIVVTNRRSPTAAHRDHRPGQRNSSRESTANHGPGDQRQPGRVGRDRGAANPLSRHHELDAPLHDAGEHECFGSGRPRFGGAVRSAGCSGCQSNPSAATGRDSSGISGLTNMSAGDVGDTVTGMRRLPNLERQRRPVRFVVHVRLGRGLHHVDGADVPAAGSGQRYCRHPVRVRCAW